jgi:hypothetical protein
MDPGLPGVALDGVVYAHTAHTLYRMDAKTFQIERVCDFQGLQGETDRERRMTDIAIDAYGVLWGVSYLRLYTCHPQSCSCILMADLREPFSGQDIYEFNALTMIPGTHFRESRDVLVGVSNDGGWFRFNIDYVTREVEVLRLGEFGYGRRSSGDAYSIANVGTFAVVDEAADQDDFLVAVDPTTGESEAVPVVSLDGYTRVFGLAGWTKHAFAFDSQGVILVVDVVEGEVDTTLLHKELDGSVRLCRLGTQEIGEGSDVCTDGTIISWWGAGVRTRITEVTEEE